MSESRVPRVSESCVRVASPVGHPSRVSGLRVRVASPGRQSPVPASGARAVCRRRALRAEGGGRNERRPAPFECVCLLRALACVRMCGTWAAIRRPASRASSICRRRRPTRVLTPPDSDNDSDPHRRTDSPCGGSGGGPAPRRHTLAYRQATGRAGPRQLEGDKPRGDGGAGPGGRRPR